MEGNIFGLEFDQTLGNAEVIYDTPDYRNIPSIKVDDFEGDKSNAPHFEMLVDI